MKNKALQWITFIIAVILGVSVLAAWFSTNIPQSNTIRVACVGDSITEGSRYTLDLGQLLGGNYSVGNFGVGLATVCLGSVKPYMNQSVFTQAKEFMPDIVVILLGTNDAMPIYQQYLANFTSDYKELITAFQTLDSKPKIYLVLPPPIFNDSLGPTSNQLTQEVIPKIRQVANETGLSLIDFYSEFESHRGYSSDGVHLTFEGSKFVATTIYQAIRSQ
jgi:lysophospholipase L1-like esterase